MTNTSEENINLNEFLELLYRVKNCIKSYDGSRLTIKKENNQSEQLVNKIFSESSSLPGNLIEIKLSSLKPLNQLIYFDLNDFIAKYNDEISQTFEESTIAIIDCDGEWLIKWIGEAPTSKNKPIFNIHEYRKTLDFLLSTHDFTPYQSSTDSEFTLISRTNGVFTVGYNNPEPLFFKSNSLVGMHSRFEEEFSKREFIQFFKEIVISGVHSTVKKYRYQEIVRQYSTLLDLAQKDYETYVSNFAFDKIKSQFKEEREKYFETIDRNIGSIGKQVVSFPLTFGATIFASYKVKDQPQFLVLILIGYFLYTIIAFLILNITSYNIKCLKDDVCEEESEIKNSYKKLYIDFEEDFGKIKKKIFNLNVVVNVLFVILVILFLLFLAYTGMHLEWVEINYINWLG
ncbi:MAG: hypothetical protein ABGX00_16115 [Allomuricauda sp.]